jgi:hypothetical protein
MSSSRKKVVVRRFSRDWVSGFVDPHNLLTGSGLEARLELLDQDGRTSSLPLNEVKMVSFVRDFVGNEANSGANTGPERLVKRTFSGRPRTEGLWLRMTFRDNDILEGIAPNDLSILEAQGVQVTPPDLRSNTQRIYVPRLALTELVVLAVIGAPGATGRRKAIAAAEEASLDLFSDLPPNTRPN